ncbi:Cytochrome P450 [Acorus gramineus]|uniref:Cytochrome P450 n=1 Tax=Acorus gramineus TaxID=55184 RepID=A0AAV9BKS9_ACOGR|nr:Cytochrome P450 [Acorus gramineus]
MSLVALLLCFSPLMLVLIHTWRSRKKSSDNTQNIPKGSSGWPFIGELIPLLKPHPSIHMSPFMEQRISKSRLPGRQVIFSGDTELNRIVLQNTGQMIKSDWPSTFDSQEFIARGGSSNFLDLGFLETEVTGLFQGGNKKESVFTSQAGQYLQFAFNMAVKFVMNCDSINPEVDQLRREYINLHKGLASLPINFPGTTYRKALQSRSIVLKFINQKVKERQQLINDGCEGYDIPSGYTVILSIAAVHMDPSLFDDPQCFNPWRWQSLTHLWPPWISQEVYP